MAEPTIPAAGAVVIAVAINLVGAKWGPIAAAAAGGFVGAFISLGAIETGGSKVAALRYLLSYTLAAALASGSIAGIIAILWHIPADETLMSIALVVGLIGGQWRELIGWLLAAAQKLFGAKTEQGRPQ